MCLPQHAFMPFCLVIERALTIIVTVRRLGVKDKTRLGGRAFEKKKKKTAAWNGLDGLKGARATNHSLYSRLLEVPCARRKGRIYGSRIDQLQRSLLSFLWDVISTNQSGPCSQHGHSSHFGVAMNDLRADQREP